MNAITQWRLKNGLTVLYRRDPSFPLTSATLLFDMGSRSELPKEAGLCSITVDLLMQGTRRRTARQLATVMESVGASMGTQVHEDYSELGFVVPATELDRAFGVMAEILKEPSFPKEEIIKEKAHVLAGLSSRKDAIFNVAYDALNSAMYGRHAYGRLVEGSAKTISQFRKSDFSQWHERAIRPERAILSWTGPMVASKAKQLTEKYLNSWRHPYGAHHSSYSSPAKVPHRNTDVTIRSTFEQAYLMVGYPAPRATDPNHIPLKVLNTILGGGMSSRLFAGLREEQGLAYEVSSFYPTRLDVSQWVIYLGLPKEKLKTAADQLDKLLQQLTRSGPTQNEVKQAKAMIRGAFLMDRQSHRRQAWYAAWWQFLGRGLDYGDVFLKAVDAVTPKQLHRLTQEILKQPRITVRVVPK